MLEVQKQKRVSPFSSKLFSRLIAFTAAFLVFALLFGSMFQMFESISMQAMLRMNEEFSAQASTISDSMQSIINTLGIQMFYISSTAKLRKSTSLTQNERVFALRELWQYAMSGSMLHSIYVFNPKLDYVYTTDNDYMSASMDGFYDQDAVALYRQRSPENRMRLYHRTFRENGEDYGSEWYSYLVYEVTASGKTGESAVMLNLNADWFREHLLNFQGENYVIVSSDSYVVASQREELNAMSLSLLGRIGEQKRGYLIDRLNGKRTICFFSPLDVNDWYCLRYVAYADCLPGLAKIRSYAWIALTLIACALLSALGVALIRVYDPYRRMTAALNRTHEVENVQQAAEQVEKIVATSLNRKREDALRLWVNGQPSEEGLVRFPAVPILLEMSPTSVCAAFSRRKRRITSSAPSARRRWRSARLPPVNPRWISACIWRHRCTAGAITACRFNRPPNCPRGIRLFWNAKSCASSIRDSRFSPKRPPSPPGRARKSWKRR
ncbi:MAG: cache domain-containing protein [Christensenellales bacterium]